MTMPHLMNCAHIEDGWCLDCVVTMQSELSNALDALSVGRQLISEYENGGADSSEIAHAISLMDGALIKGGR